MSYKSIKQNSDIEDASFVNSWLKDPNNRTYEKIDFLPMQEAPLNVYDTFKGYEAQNKELYDIDIKTTCIYKHTY